MTAFRYENYKSFLKDALEIKKKRDPSLSFARLAEAAKIQRSYLSQVLNGAPHLSGDQLYLIAQCLGLAHPETDYLLLLLEIDRSTVEERKHELTARRKSLQAKSLKTENYLSREPNPVSAKSLTRYYCDPLIPIVHLFLTVPKYRKAPADLASRLGASAAQIAHALSVLEECELIRFDEKGLQVLRPFLHLEKESPLAKVNGSFFRLKAIEALQRERSADDYFFTATFSATDALRLEIKEHFLAFLKRRSREIESCPSEQVFQMNFDLFKL